MNRQTALVLAILAALAGSLVVPEPAAGASTPRIANAIVSAGFEGDTYATYTHGCCAAPWTSSGFQAALVANDWVGLQEGYGVAARDCTKARSGSCSLRVTLGTGGNVAFQRVDYVRGTPTDTVQVSFWLLNPGGGSQAGKWFMFNFLALDASSNVIGQTAVENFVPLSTWTYFQSNPMTVPAGTAYFLFGPETRNGCGCTAAHSAWLDDVALSGLSVSGAPPPPTPVPEVNDSDVTRTIVNQIGLLASVAATNSRLDAVNTSLATALAGTEVRLAQLELELDDAQAELVASIATTSAGMESARASLDASIAATNARLATTNASLGDAIASTRSDVATLGGAIASARDDLASLGASAATEGLEVHVLPVSPGRYVVATDLRGEPVDADFTLTRNGDPLPPTQRTPIARGIVRVDVVVAQGDILQVVATHALARASSILVVAADTPPAVAPGPGPTADDRTTTLLVLDLAGLRLDSARTVHDDRGDLYIELVVSGRAQRVHLARDADGRFPDEELAAPGSPGLAAPGARLTLEVTRGADALCATSCGPVDAGPIEGFRLFVDPGFGNFQDVVVERRAP